MTVTLATPSQCFVKNSSFVPSTAGIYCGCGTVFQSCHEKKYRNLYLHAVLDYMEKVGYHFETEYGIMELYHTHLKRDPFEDTYFCELDQSLEIPVCMENELMMDTLFMRKTHSLMMFLKVKCIYDFHHHVGDVANGRKPRVEYPEYEEE